MAAIKQELGISHDAAMAAEAGKPNKKPRDKKNIRNLKMREKFMFDLEQGTTSLLSFQQAIGGSLSRSA